MTNREIDIEVADAIGQRRCNCHPLRPSSRFSSDTGFCLTCEAPLCPYFSTDPVASKQLRDKMRADGWYTRVEQTPRGKCCADFWRNGKVHTWRADTEEMAVALAALAAKGKPMQEVQG